MKVCQYDNPATMCRELWQDRKMIAHLSADLLCMKTRFTGDKYMHFGFDLSEWKTGKTRGDKQAIEGGAE